MKRDWTAASGKLLLEGSRCRACGDSHRIERAHVIGRFADKYPPLGWEEDRGGEWREPYRVVADRIIPLCWRCHRAQHDGNLDLLPLLSVAEQVQAVADAGGIEAAMKRLMPSEQPSKVVPKRLVA